MLPTRTYSHSLKVFDRLVMLKSLNNLYSSLSRGRAWLGDEETVLLVGSN